MKTRKISRAVEGAFFLGLMAAVTLAMLAYKLTANVPEWRTFAPLKFLQGRHWISSGAADV